MRAGKLDRLIRIESRVDTVNSVGQPVPAWSVVATNVPASYDPTRGREFFAGMQLVVTDAAMFSIRYRPGIDAAMRVIFEGRVWDIAAVEPGFGRHRSLNLYCGTGLTEG